MIAAKAILKIADGLADTDQHSLHLAALRRLRSAWQQGSDEAKDLMLADGMATLRGTREFQELLGEMTD